MQKLTTLDYMFYAPLITLMWTLVVFTIVKIVKSIKN